MTEKRFIKFKIKKKNKKRELYINETLAFLFITFFFILAFYLGPAITGFTVLTHTSSTDFTGTFNQTQTDGENVTLSTQAGASATKEENYDVPTDGGSIFYGALNWDFQTFTIGTLGVNLNQTLSSVKVEIYRYGSPGTLTFAIQAINSTTGKPTGVDLSTGTTDGNTLTNASTGEWREITMSSYYLQASTQYALIVKALSGDASNSLWWMYTGSGTYTGGGYGYTNDGGSTWGYYGGGEGSFEIWATRDVYFSSGTYTSQAINAGASVQWDSLNWSSTGADGWLYSGVNYLTSDISSTDLYYNGSDWFVSGGGGNQILQYNADFSSNPINYSIAAQDTNPNGIYYNESNWFMVGYANDYVHEFDSNWTATGNNWSIASQDTAPAGIVWNGSNWFMVGQSNDYVHEFDSNWTATGNNWSIASQNTAPNGIYWDGTNWWMAGSEITGKVYKYDSNWSYTGTSFSVNSEDNTPTGLFLKDSNWYMVGFSNDKIYKYDKELKFQSTSCSSLDCSDGTFVGPDNTSSTYFTSNTTLNTTLTPNNQYFQYKAYLETSNTSITPYLESVEVSYTVLNNPDNSTPIINSTDSLQLNYTNETLACNFLCNDADTADTLTYDINWIKNGIPTISFSNESCVNPSYNSPTLTDDNTTEADLWSCSINITDNGGLSSSTIFSENITIANYSPVINGTLDNVTQSEDFSDLADLIPVGDFNANFSDIDEAPNSYTIVSQTNSSTSCYLDASYNLDCSSVANVSGTDLYTIELNDSSQASIRLDWQITISAVNDLPWKTGELDNATQSEDFSLLDNLIPVSDFNANWTDVEQATPSTYELVTSTNTSTSCYFDGSNNWDCSSIANQSGVDNYTISLNDSSGVPIIYDWNITINIVNDQPWMTDSIGFDNSTWVEDAGTFTAISNDSFAGNFSDVEDNNNPTTTLLSQSDTSAVSCSMSSGDLSCTTVANQSGTNNIVLNLSDTGGESFVMSTLITISAVNDQPYWDLIPNATVAITEDTANQNVTIGYQQYFRDAEDDKNPTLSIINTNETSVSCAMSSGDIQCSPTSNFTGQFILTINGSDSGYLSEVTSFEVNVTAVNDNPWNQGLNNIVMNEDNGTSIIYINSELNNTFRDVEEDNKPFTYDLSQDNTTAISCSLSAINDISCTTLANQSGTNTITLEMNDSSNLNTTLNFLITVNAINDLPWGLSLYLPLNNSNLSTNTPLLSIYNATDVENDPLTYYLEVWNDSLLTQIGYVNASINETDTTTNDTTSVLEDGDYYWRALVSDGTDNSSFTEELIFNIDTVFPIITLDDPVNDTSFNNDPNLPGSTTAINLTITDTNLEAVLWSNDSALNNYSDFIPNYPSTKYGINLTDYAEGAINFTIWANDSANNIAEKIYNWIIDSLPPIIEWISPDANAKVHLTTEIRANATDALSSIDSLWVNINSTNSDNYTMAQSGNEYSYNLDTTIYTDGQYTLFIYGNDTAGNENRTAARYVTIDNTAPAITLAAPADNSNFNYTDIAFNFTVVELNDIANCSLIINSTINSTSTSISKSPTENPIEINLTDASYNWNINCTDEVLNEGNSSIYEIRIDIPPEIEFISPTNENNSYVNTDSFYANVSVSESFEDTIIFYLNGSKYQTFTNQTHELNFTDLADNIYYYLVWINDSLNNQNETENRTITIDTTLPSEFNLSTPINDTNSTDNSPLLTWDSTTDTNFDNYTIEISNDSDFSLINSTYNTTTNSFSEWSPQLSIGAWYWRVTAYDKATNSKTSNTFSFTVQETIAPTTTISSTSAGGAGGTSKKPYTINIIAPDDITIYSNDSLTIPLIITNPSDINLRTISLNVSSNESDVSPYLDITNIPSLRPKEQRKINLKIITHTEPGTYGIIISAIVIQPYFTDTFRIYANLIEKNFKTKNEVNKQLDFAKKLFSGNPQCLDLSEFIKQAEASLEQGKYDQALNLAKNAIEGCNKLLALEKPQIVSKKLPFGLEKFLSIDYLKKKTSIILISEILGLLIITTIAIRFIKKRKKPKYNNKFYLFLLFLAVLNSENKHKRKFIEIRELLLKTLSKENELTLNELATKSNLSWKTAKLHLIYLKGKGYVIETLSTPYVRMFKITERGLKENS